MRKDINISQYAFVIRQLARKEHIKNTSETRLMELWNVANPLLYMIIMTAFYSTLFLHDIENYPLFFLIGIIHYNFFNGITSGAINSLADNKNFLLTTRLPNNVFLLEKVYSRIIYLFYQSIALVILLIYFRIPVNLSLLCIIPILLVAVFLHTGIGKFLAVWGVLFPDIDYIYSIITTIIFFASGLMYPLSKLSVAARQVIVLNPLFLLVDMTRDCVLYARMPELNSMIKLILTTAFVYVFGTIYFEKSKKEIMMRL
ncbi:lipopolysaccharide transport system permease protein [Acetitomaculum ruminis DSM 5522]|uniref:Transport permease protein n=1 Tax=Acetitomaculum ruminis DSM 5522 TaxID=1120918 RepID=A0A1I0VKM1_9FIRM|nr:ABC transporter permease [Acetitomaculum ruminis]SFA76563.1 lipopolysaccharide transport system permease protein [Acetitomaculum ruminis DSM 5522]